MNHGRQFGDTLGVSKPSSSKGRRRKIHIAQLSESAAGEGSEGPSAVDDLLAPTDASYMSKLDKIQRETPPRSTCVPKVIDLPTITPKPTSTIDLSIRSITDKSSKEDMVRSKYKAAQKDYTTGLMSNEDITNIIKASEELVSHILDGSSPSYFYTIAKRYQKNSPTSIISNDALISIRKNIYFGYVGSNRWNQLTFAILRHPNLSKQLRKQEKTNKVIQFWGVDPFAKYVLAPEVVANLIKKNEGLADINLAYDMMEDTHDYGIYITDNIPLRAPADVASPTPKAAERTTSGDSDDSFDPLDLFQE